MKKIIIISISLIFAIACNQPQSKTADGKVEEMKNLASKLGLKPKEVHVHKTTAYDSKLRLNPNSLDELITIPKGTEVEILAEQLVKQGMLENAWYKVTYGNKIGWVSEHNFNKSK